MVVDSILLHAESGPIDHRKDAPQFKWQDFNVKSIIDAIYMMKDLENSKHSNSDISKEMEISKIGKNPKIEKEDQIIYTNTSFVFGEI